ncbi:MAG: hypothetical protein RQ723_04985 [Desulfuromonadales bacterium]|nr:hypothetical protein [Desulfuromonadales bacterium]
MNRKRLLLTILLAILALCLLYAYLATPRLQKAPPRDVARQSRPVQAGKATGTTATSRVRLAVLQEEEAEFPGAARDIFRFRPKPAPKPRPVEVTPVEVVEPEPVTIVPPEPVPPTPVEEVRVALSRFTFLGFVARGGEHSVFLSSGGELFVVKAGERFGKEQEFLVTAIEEQLLEVRRDGQTQTIQIPLVEQESLRPAVSKPARRPPIALPESELAPVPEQFQEALERARENPVAPEGRPEVPTGESPLLQNLQNLLQGGADGTNR